MQVRVCTYGSFVSNVFITTNNDLGALGISAEARKILSKALYRRFCVRPYHVFGFSYLKFYVD